MHRTRLLCFQSKSQNFLSESVTSWYCGQFQELTTTQEPLACLNSHFLLLLLLLCGFLGSTKRLWPGLVKFNTAVAYHFCLSLYYLTHSRNVQQGPFSQPL